MNRPARLQWARNWLPTYAGKNVVTGYRKYFGVDWECAFKELDMLGVRIDSEYKINMLKCVAAKIAARKLRKARHRAIIEAPPHEQNEYFAYIAGYSEGGFAYGITWEEWEKLELLEMIESGKIPSQIEDEEEDFIFDYDSLPLPSEGDDDFDLPF